ncbi:MAG: aminoacyl-tRNA hydrolase [Christensenellales bacterium]|jgi:PTH1 family peptidyl-tRNA hydrolase
MRMIVGLGNPGIQYRNTRHNVGFDVVDALACAWKIPFRATRFTGLVGEGVMLGHKVLVVKPQTYMNKSGECVEQVMDYYRVEPHELIVVLDDIDLPVGRIRVRSFGGAGTHNGLRSIVDYLGAGSFARVRVGIGPIPPDTDLAHFVLSRFREEEKETVQSAVVRAGQAVEALISDGIEAAQARFNAPPE